jgi:hypothetical protein
MYWIVLRITDQDLGNSLFESQSLAFWANRHIRTGQRICYWTDLTFKVRQLSLKTSPGCLERRPRVMSDQTNDTAINSDRLQNRAPSSG